MAVGMGMATRVATLVAPRGKESSVAGMEAVKAGGKEGESTAGAGCMAVMAVMAVVARTVQSTAEAACLAAATGMKEAAKDCKNRQETVRGQFAHGFQTL